MSSMAVGRARPARSIAGAHLALTGRGELVLLIAVAAGGTLLRFPTLGLQSFWADEASTVISVLRPDLGHTIGQVGATEKIPYLYYVLAWGWTRIFGTAEAGVRSLSAVIGTATIPVAWWAGRALVSRAAGLAAAAFVAASPMMVWYSQEARPNALLVLTGAVSLGFFAEALRRRSTKAIGWWGAASALAVATHYFALFTIFPEAAFLLFLVPERRRAIGWTSAGVAATFFALVPLAVHQANQGHAEWISGIALRTRVGYLFQQYVLGYYHGSPSFVLGAAAVVPCAAVAALAVRAGLRERSDGWRIALALGLVTIAVPLAAAVAGADFFFPRNVITSWVPLAIAAGAAAHVPRAGPVIVAVACAAAVTATIMIDRTPSLQRTDWRDAARALGPAVRARAVIGADTGSHPLQYYMPHVRRITRGKVTVAEIDAIGRTDLPRLPGRRVPPGFRLLARGSSPGFVYERYVAAGPRIVSIPALSHLRVGTAHAPIMFQAPR